MTTTYKTRKNTVAFFCSLIVSALCFAGASLAVSTTAAHATPAVVSLA